MGTVKTQFKLRIQMKIPMKVLKMNIPMKVLKMNIQMRVLKMNIQMNLKIAMMEITAKPFIIQTKAFPRMIPLIMILKKNLKKLTIMSLAKILIAMSHLV